MENFNSEIVGSIGILFFACLISISLFHQAISIYEKENGETVLKRLNSYLVSMQLVVFIYGVKTNYAPVIFNGASGFLGYLAILIMLYKFEIFRSVDKKLFIVMIVFALTIIIIPDTKITEENSLTFMGLYYLLYSAALIYFFKELIEELYRLKKRGVLSIYLLASYLIANIFWLVFAVAVGDWALIITNIFSSFLVIGAIVLWFRSKK